jgi:hypothetical protein
VIALIEHCESVKIFTAFSVGMHNMAKSMANNSGLVDDGHICIDDCNVRPDATCTHTDPIVAVSLCLSRRRDSSV